MAQMFLYCDGIGTAPDGAGGRQKRSHDAVAVGNFTDVTVRWSEHRRRIRRGAPIVARELMIRGKDGTARPWRRVKDGPLDEHSAAEPKWLLWCSECGPQKGLTVWDRTLHQALRLAGDHGRTQLSLRELAAILQGMSQAR